MRDPKDVEVNGRKLKDILEEHLHWLKQDCDGWQRMKADLSYANLGNVNLYGVDLLFANLHRAYLHQANLFSANLYGADLSEAILANADLRYADLRYANLENIKCDECITFCDTNVLGANLNRACFEKCSLWGLLNLDQTEDPAKGYRTGKILTEPIIGYKKCRDVIGKSTIVTLEIPRGAIVFSINGSKCRTNKAKVIAIDGANRAISYYKYMTYYVGDEFTIYDFDCQYNIECGEGIHFFLTKEEAKDY